MTQITDAIGEKLGKGLAFPITLENGKAKYEENLSLVKQSVEITLNWYWGTRFYLGEFGSKLFQILEQPNDQISKSELLYHVTNDLFSWEPRISILSIDYESPNFDSVNLKIRYQLKKSALVGEFNVSLLKPAV